MASENAILNEVEIDFDRLDLLQPETWKINKIFDIIISNPPYVCNSEKELMNKNVLEYEPSLALFVDDEDPLIFYKQIIKFSYQYLNTGGKIFCEINQYLGKESKYLFESEGFQNVKILKDFKDNYRILSCSLPKS